MDEKQGGEPPPLASREQRFFDTKNERYATVRRRISRAIGAFNRSQEMHEFYDPVGRRLTPSARTPDEHPLTRDDWALLAQIFPRFWHSERELLSIPLMPLNLALPPPWQKNLARPIGRIDDWLLKKFPEAGRYGRRTILVMAA
jgi:hypothetical protein